MSRLSSSVVDRYAEDIEDVRGSAVGSDDARPDAAATKIDDEINYANYLKNKEWLEKKKRLDEGRDFAKVQFKRIREKAAEDRRLVGAEAKKRKDNLDLLRATTRKMARVPIAEALKKKALNSHIQSQMYVVDDILGVHSSDDDNEDSNSTPVPSGDLKKTLINIATRGVKAQLTWRPSAVESTASDMQLGESQPIAPLTRPKPSGSALARTRAPTIQLPARARVITPVARAAPKLAAPKRRAAPAQEVRPAAKAAKAGKPKAASPPKKAAASASTRRVAGPPQRRAGASLRAADDSLLGMLETQLSVFGNASGEGTRAGTRQLHPCGDDDAMVLQEDIGNDMYDVEDEEEGEEEDEEDPEEFIELEQNLASCSTVMIEVERMSELLREISEGLEDTIVRRALVGAPPAAADSQQLRDDLGPFIAQRVDDSTKVIVSSLMTSWGDRLSKLEERVVQTQAKAMAEAPPSSAARLSRSTAAQTVEQTADTEVKRRGSHSKYEFSYDNDLLAVGQSYPSLDLPAVRSESAPRPPALAADIRFSDDLLRGSMGILDDRDDAIAAFNASVSSAAKRASDLDFVRRLARAGSGEDAGDALMDGSVHRAGAGPSAVAPAVRWSSLHGLVPSLRNVGELASVLSANLAVHEESERGKDVDWTDDESESGEDDNRIISLYAAELLRQKVEDARAKEEALLAEAKEGLRQYMAALEDPEPVTDVSCTDSPVKAVASGDEELLRRRDQAVPAFSDGLPDEDVDDDCANAAPQRSSRPVRAAARAQAEEEPPRYTPAELRQFMLDELQRQDDILKYELELSELEQMRSLQSANEMVQQILMKSQVEAMEYRKEQEISLQQQAYEVSLTTAIANAQVAMKEKMMSHERTVSDLKEQLQQQALQNDYAILIAHAEQLQQASEQLGSDRWGAVRKASSMEPVLQSRQQPFDDDIDAAEISYAASIDHSRISTSSTIPEEIDDVPGLRRTRRALSDEGDYSFEFEEASEIEEERGVAAARERPKASAASPARQAQRSLRPGLVAASTSSALTLLSRRSEQTRGFLKSSSVDSGRKALSSSVVSEYKDEMDYRLMTQEKAIKIRLHLLKSKRKQQLEYLHQQRALLQSRSSPRERSDLMTLPQILGEEKIVNEAYAEERALLEKERWSLNANKYREMRKYQQLKRDVEGFASVPLGAKMASSPSELSSSPDSAAPPPHELRIALGLSARDADSATTDSAAPLKRPAPKGRRAVDAEEPEPAERGRARSVASDKRAGSSKKKASATPKTPHYALPLDRSRSRSNTPEKVARSPKKPSSPKGAEGVRPQAPPRSQRSEPREPRALPDYLKSVDDTYAESDEDQANDEAIVQLEKSIVERQQRIADMKRNITSMNTEYNKSEIIRMREIERDRLIAEEAVLKVSLSEDIQRVSREFKDMKQAAMSRSSVYQEVVTKWVDIIEKPFEEEAGVMNEEDELDDDSWVSEGEAADDDIVSQAHEGQLVRRAREHAAAFTIQNTMRNLAARREYSSRRSESELARAALKDGKIVGNVVQEHYQTILTEDINLDDSFASGDVSSEDDDVLFQRSRAIEEAIDDFAGVKRQREAIEKERLAAVQERERLEEQERARATRQEALAAAKAASSPPRAALLPKEVLNDSVEYDAENEVSKSQLDVEESFSKTQPAEDAAPLESDEKEEPMGSSQQLEDSGLHTVTWVDSGNEIKKSVSESSLNKIADDTTDNTIGTYETLESLKSIDLLDIPSVVNISLPTQDAGASSALAEEEEPSSSVDEDLDEISDQNELREDEDGDDSDGDSVDQSQLNVSVAKSERLDVSLALSERSGTSAASIAKSERSLGRSDRLDLSTAISEKSVASVAMSEISTATGEFSVVDNPGKINASSVDAVFDNRLSSLKDLSTATDEFSVVDNPGKINASSVDAVFDSRLDSLKESYERTRSEKSPHVQDEDFVNRSVLSMGTIKSSDEPGELEVADSIYKAIAEHSFLSVSSSQVSLNTEGNEFPEVSIIDQHGEESIDESIASALEGEEESVGEAPASPIKPTPLTLLANIPKLDLTVGAGTGSADSEELDELYDFESKAPSADTPRLPEGVALPAANQAEEKATKPATPYHDWSPQVVETASAVLNAERFESIAGKMSDASFRGDFISAEGYNRVKSTLLVDAEHSLAVFHKVNAVLSELHALRHEVRHSGRLSRKHLVAKSMPLRSDILLEHVLSVVRRDQAEVAAVVGNSKDLFALIKVDAVEELEDKYQEELARVGNDVADNILTRLLEQTAGSLLKKF